VKPIEPAIYALLLLLSLGLSWNAWKGEDAGANDSSSSPIVLFEPGSGGLAELHWQGEKAVTSVVFESKGKKLRSWVSAGKRVKVEGPAASADAAGDDDSADSGDSESPTPPIYGEPELRSFPGGKQVTELAERFTPLIALRRFDGLDAETITEMGLDETTSSLSVTSVSGKNLNLTIWAKAYGSSDTYARDADGTVYLLSSKVLGALRSAESRLMERNLLGFEAIEISEATLESPDGRKRPLRHEGMHDEANAYWADPNNPDDHDAEDSFMEKLFQLRATAFPKDDEHLEDERVETVLRARFPGDDQPYLELGRVEDNKRSREGEPAYNWHARTHLTRDIWVKVSRNSANELSDNLDKVLNP
jgi:hypothetical protein